jgi:adenylate cyclase
MATETERKYLVKGEFAHLSVMKIEITQAYLSKDPEKTIRIRTYGEKGYLTIKSCLNKEMITRCEWEFEISLTEAEELIGICLPGKIIKTRYLVPSGEHTFEVDVFHDRNEGLIIAEIELSSEDETFEIPDWLGIEVTGIPEYYNSNLVK